jgi:hypothetical protein
MDSEQETTSKKLLLYPVFEVPKHVHKNLQLSILLLHWLLNSCSLVILSSTLTFLLQNMSPKFQLFAEVGAYHSL